MNACFTLFEIYMWIVILTLIVQWPESQNSCCMIVFVVRIFWTWAVCSTFLLDTTSDRFFREVFEDLSLPKHCDGEISIMCHKTHFVKLYCSNNFVAADVKMDGCVLNENDLFSFKWHEALISWPRDSLSKFI